MLLENQMEKREEQMPYLLHQTNEVLTSRPDIDGTLGAVILRRIGISIVSMHRTSWQPFTWLKVKVTPFGGFTGIKSISPNLARLTLGGYSVCCPTGSFLRSCSVRLAANP